MKSITLTIGAVLTALTLSNCADMGPNTQRGAATGAIIGGVAGGVLGHQSGRGLEGAALGAAAGGVAGGAIGNNRDQQERRYYRDRDYRY
ncbi:YMGG-like glycine zipper-containing protein [Luteolibacter sp. SL250]|uniref:YMGG-like glycine zipper-containing protein n=1 Tax=Luteolibacter sp. SL250 TaxID=2995170 RepID=UPI0022700A9D|nr:glycine zipper domain-containing protein [Luteolibacter sp. SL250]WAC21382.1 YMGG-like glycine zipper-containing protein [Luteolibacter sp. SL250]